MLQLELYVADNNEAANLFISAFGMKVIEDKPGFRQLRHKDNFDIMLFTPTASAEGRSHWPLPTKGEGGVGIEIVMPVSDGAKAHQTIERLGYACSELKRAPWGTLEFTCHMKEGYLIRVKQIG